MNAFIDFAGARGDSDDTVDNMSNSKDFLDSYTVTDSAAGTGDGW